MKFGRFAQAFAPIVVIALAAAASGCDGPNVRINSEEGKVLSELDLSGAPPRQLVLLGPDEVRVSTGDKLAITMAGDADAQKEVRFTLKDGSLGILRTDKVFSGRDKVAVINVTMPAPEEVVMAGSGRIVLAALAGKAKASVAGSGTVEATAIDSESLDINIAGSGLFRGAGKSGKLKLNVVGSGSANLDGLKVESADVNVAGSGNTAFASDGEVKANIMGSGEVRVKGRARCTVSSMGSGRLICEGGVTEEDATEASKAPEAPEPPEAPKAPEAP